jgi:ATP-dependent RNA helicase DeaD
MNKFKQLGLDQGILTQIHKLGFATPTKIQEESIPLIINGKDVIGESATGSGKTLAFGCGVMKKVTPYQGLQSLILTPTRELAEQVKNSLRELAPGKKFNIIAVYGGVSISKQIKELRMADVVIATPGRLLDHIHRRTINTSNIKLLVIDEADRMFDMGFQRDVEKIIGNCPRDRQTLFFSATIPPEIMNFANRHMKEPEKVFAEKMVDPEKLEQTYLNVTRSMKFHKLMELLGKERSGLSMVFCNSRRATDYVVRHLKAENIKAIGIHGGLTQSKRSMNLNQFNNYRANVLVCTDVASRGLHIDNVSNVYNYDIPKDPNDYIHRIGRTARAGESGKVINLICHTDNDSFSKILRTYRTFEIENLDMPGITKYGAKKQNKPDQHTKKNYIYRSKRHSRPKGNFNQKRR